jgi:aryl-alcohol dehydrogenase-like predicted oxidoreductase
MHVGDVPEAEAIPALDTLAALRDEGKIRAYCWSSWMPEAGEILARHGGAAFMHECNVFTPKEELLAICERNNMASINIFPLAMGLLGGKYNAASRFSAGEVRGGGHSWVGYFENGAPTPKYLDRLAAIREALTSGGRTLAQGALCWVLAKSPLTIPIPGFKSEAQAQENAQALSFGPLTSEQMAEIDRLLGE